MPKIDLEKERKRLDREITFFHFKRAKQRASRCLDLAIKTGDNFFFFYFLAQRYILREDFHSAIKYLDYCLRIRGKDGCAYNDKALCLAELGKHKEALVCFDEGIRRDRDCASLYHNKGWLLHSLEKFTQALLYFKKALEIEPDRVESLFSLADTYTYLGESMKAKEYFQKAIFQIRGKCAYIYKQILKRLKNIK
ncbi:MAG: tetratricopeptide repeat protein [Candidatus Omnitrophota bacterium]|nr:tetratricopeptide repeat protein [Candidatus Omnitrophota bacterium]